MRAGLLLALLLVPQCRTRTPAPAPEVAWINPAGELVIADGYVLTTSGECAALSNPSLPPIPFEKAERCFRKAAE